MSADCDNPAIRSDELVAKMFGMLAAQWTEETGFESSVQRMVLHPAYLRIIGLGPQVVPLLLADLERTGRHWFAALVAITGIDAGKGHSTVTGAANAWLAWGRANRLLPGLTDASE